MCTVASAAAPIHHMGKMDLTAAGGFVLSEAVNWKAFLAQHDPLWVVKPLKWDEGAFIGNGMIGAMVYGEEDRTKRHVIRFVMGRSDVVAARQRGWSPRVPIGEFDLEMTSRTCDGTRMRLSLWDAELRGEINTLNGGVRFRAYVHAVKMVMVLEVDPSPGETDTVLQWYAYPDVDPVLKNADTLNFNQYIPDVEQEHWVDRGVSVNVQKFAEGNGCITAWCRQQLPGGKSRYYCTIINGIDQQSRQLAVETILDAVNTDLETFTAVHRSWWHQYYQRSFVSLPDTQLEGFYWIQMYKLACATRAEYCIIDNQGPWLAPTPWPGIWFNMNVQMSYAPVYTSNRLELGLSLCQALQANFANLITNVPEAYRHDAAGLGRSCSYDLKSKVGYETGNLTWVLHNCWRQYRYSMDETLLQELIYPLLKRSINYYIHLLEPGPDGKLHLPSTMSPEYFAYASFTMPDCSYDLALLKWGCQTLLEICEQLRIGDELAAKWQYILDNLVDLPSDETGIMLGRDTPLQYGHRHFSHLLAVFPLHILNTDDPANWELAFRSLRHWIGREGDLRGFSFTGAASIAATLGLGDEAVRYIKTLMHIIKPNTMYKEAGPVIETPLAGAEAIHDLLLQSWGGMIRVFPAVPDHWKDVVIHNLRAEGAFLISAVRRNGANLFVRVKSLAGGPCRVKCDLGPNVKALAARNADFQSIGKDLYQLDLDLGDEVILYAGDTSPNFSIEPLQPEKSMCNYFGGFKPWRLYGIPMDMN